MKMEQRLQLAGKLLAESSAELTNLRKQRDTLLSVVNRIQSTILSRLDQHRIDILNLNKVFHDFHQQFQSLMNDVSSDFDAQTSNSAEVIKQLQYQNKCLRDQVNVRRLKYNVLNKSHATLVKKHAECSRKRKHMANDAILRCMRCKVRKNIIDRLEQDIADKIEENFTLNKSMETLNKSVDTLKESNVAARRELVEVRQKCKDEIEKISAANNASSSSPQQLVEVGRTPHDGDSPKAPTTPAVDHSKCEKEIIALQWSVSSKTAETVRLHNQLQEAKRDKSGVAEEMQFYRNRSEHLMDAVREINDNYQQLQTDNNQLRAQLEESEQTANTLRTLLANLATGVSSLLE